MWNKKYEVLVIEADSQPNVAVYTMRYSHTDGRTVTKVERVSEPNLLRKIAIDSINELERIDSINELIARPILGEVDLNPKPLTPDEIKSQEIETSKRELEKSSIDLKLGVIKQEEYDNVLAGYRTLLGSK